MFALALAVVLLAAMGALRYVTETRALRLERKRRDRNIAALERELAIGLSLAERLGDDPLAVTIEDLPTSTPLGLHIDCLLRMGVITFAEWLVLADEHTPLTFTSEPRFDPPTVDDIAEADRRRREDWSRLT